MILFLLIPLAIIIWIVVSSRQRNAAQEEARQATLERSEALLRLRYIEKCEVKERALWRREREK